MGFLGSLCFLIITLLLGLVVEVMSFGDESDSD